jgi:hypothetical protein
MPIEAVWARAGSKRVIGYGVSFLGSNEPDLGGNFREASERASV